MRDERGEMSLIGLLVASTLFLGVLGATLSTFNLSERFLRTNGERAEAQTRARTAIDRLARELRNLEAPSGATPQVVDVNADHDIVFRVSDSRLPNAGANTTNVQRVRWCLDGSRRLWRGLQTWTTATVPAMPSTSSCPGTWSAAKVVAQDVVNSDLGLQTFAYDATDPKLVAGVRVTVALDADRNGGATPTRVSTGVFLRNQNRPPVADFDATVGGGGVITLNGSRSQDPESAPLQFQWKDGSTVLTCKSIVCSYDPPGATAPRTLTLTVTDGAGLQATSPAKVVTA